MVVCNMVISAGQNPSHQCPTWRFSNPYPLSTIPFEYQDNVIQILAKDSGCCIKLDWKDVFKVLACPSRFIATIRYNRGTWQVGSSTFFHIMIVCD